MNHTSQHYDATFYTVGQRPQKTKLVRVSCWIPASTPDYPEHYLPQRFDSIHDSEAWLQRNGYRA